MIDNEDDLRFVKDLISGYTLTSKESQQAMLDALRYVAKENIPGDIVECGVWRGGNIILARKILPERACWLYDTFTGMTMPGDEDRRRSGKKAKDSYNTHLRNEIPWCMASLSEVRQCLTEKEVLDDGLCRFIEGDVLETLLLQKNIPEEIAILRLDTDWYASTKLELDVLYPRLMTGGVCLIDDYGHWRGCKKAVDEFFGKDLPEYTQIDYSAISFIKKHRPWS